MSRRTTARFAWTLCALTIACTIAGMLLLALSGSTVERVRGDGNPLRALPFPVFATVGALIVSRRPENVLGWVLVGAGFSTALTTNGLGYGYVHYAVFGRGQGLPAGEWVAWFHQWENAFGFGLGPLILLLFPTGRPPSPRWRPIVWSTLALAGATALLAATLPGPLLSFPNLTNPAGLFGSAGKSPPSSSA
jgi:hypothetical protein